MKSLRPRTLLLAIALHALPVPLHAAGAAGLNPGLYEYTIKMSMPGMPEMPMQSTQRCLTNKDVEGNKSFEMPQERGSDCQVRNQTQSGSQFAYVITCTKPQKMDGAVKGSFTPTSMTMDMTMTMAGAPGPMTQSISAKRLGDCKQ
jgi:Protein of unknown function (DUF3617)